MRPVPASADMVYDLLAAQGHNGFHHLYRLRCSSFIPRPADVFPCSEPPACLHDSSPLPPSLLPAVLPSPPNIPRRRPCAEIVYPEGFKEHPEFDYLVIHESSKW